MSADPFDEDAWYQLYDTVLHQGTVYQAALAAVPHMIAIATSHSVAERYPFIDFIGSVATGAVEPDEPDDLWRDFMGSFPAAKRLVDSLLRTEEPGDLLVVASTHAALEGCRGVAAIIRQLAEEWTFEIDCPSDDCGCSLMVDFDDEDRIVIDDGRAVNEIMRNMLPSFDPSLPWREEDAISRLVAELDAGSQADAASKISALDCRIACPHCGSQFDLLAPLLEANEI